MSDEPTDDKDEPEQQEDGAKDNSRGFHLKAGLRPLSKLLGSLAAVNVSDSPPPPADPGGWTTDDEPDHHRETDESSRKRTKRVRGAESAEYHVDTRVEDNEFVVTADIPGASKDDISVGINPKTNTLVISKEGTVLRRVDLPWHSPKTTNVWFNNGILEVRLRSTSSDELNEN